jgi:hypothetical protein
VAIFALVQFYRSRQNIADDKTPPTNGTGAPATTLKTPPTVPPPPTISEAMSVAPPTSAPPASSSAAMVLVARDASVPLVPSAPSVPSVATTFGVADAGPPAETGSLVQQAQRALERGQAARAIDLARRATQASPGNADAWLTLGAAYDAAGQSGAAKAAYRACVQNGRGPSVNECRALAGP